MSVCVLPASNNLRTIAAVQHNTCAVQHQCTYSHASTQEDIIKLFNKLQPGRGAFAGLATGTQGHAAASRLSRLAAFGSNPGELIARLYRPPSLVEGAPLVVVLHGCTQTASAYDQGAAWTAAADDHGFAVLFPESRTAYLDRVSKRHILAAVAEVAGDAKAQVWAGLKKEALVELAEPLLTEARWLPAPLRTPAAGAAMPAAGGTEPASEALQAATVVSFAERVA